METSTLTQSIKYCGINQSVNSDNPNATLLDISIDNKIPHLHECGGHGKCTTCRVRVLDGAKNLTPPSSNEKAMARKRRWDPSIRLACQTRAKGEVSIQRLVWTSAEVSKLQVETVPEGASEERSLAILFCDMRNFTSITSRHSTFDMAHMLNRFFTSLGDPILMNNGIIYQYVGDEIIGLFGTGGGDPEKVCMDAIRAGLGMRYALQRLNRMEMKDFDTEFDIGIGIHFGKAYVGHLGHPQHRQFAVIGDPVNVASRIQAQNKNLQTKFLISEKVKSQLPKNSLKIGLEFKVRLKGKEEPFELTEVLNFATPDVNLEVQASLEFLLKNEDRFAKVFYDKVFAKAPQVRSLFQNNMLQQGRMLTHMLSGIVYSLARPKNLQLSLQKLGKDHVKYGVRKEYFPVVKEALLETIEEEMGASYRPEVKYAWEVALEVVITLMQSSLK